MIPPQDGQHGVMGTQHGLQRLTDTLEALMQGQSQQQQRGAQMEQQLATWTEHLTSLVQHVAAMTTHLRQQWVLVGLLVGLTLGLCGGMGWQLWHPPAMEYVRALGALDTVVGQQWSSLPKPAQDALSATYTQLGLEPKSPLSPTTEPAVLNLQAQVEAQRQKVQAEQQQLEEERHLYKEYQQLQAEQEWLRQEREKLQKGSAPQGAQVALGVDAPPPAPPPQAEGEQGERERRKHQAEETKRQRREAEQAAGEHRRQAEETERQRREAEQAEQRQHEHMLVAQGMKFIVTQQILCLTTKDSIVMGTTTLTTASPSSCEDARRRLVAEDEGKNDCSPRWPDAKKGAKRWIGTESCPAP